MPGRRDCPPTEKDLAISESREGLRTTLVRFIDEYLSIPNQGSAHLEVRITRVLAGDWSVF
jgi:hypothetical protein